MREGVLEELLPGEVLKIGVVDPALAHLFIRQREDVLEQQQPEHEPAFNRGPALVAEQRRDLAVEPLPIELARELHQFVLHVDDLVEPRPEQIAFTRRLVLLRPHRSLRCGNGITVRARRESKMQIARFRAFSPETLQSQNRSYAKNRISVNRLGFVHGELIRSILGLVVDLFRSRAALEAEVLVLRQQITVLRRGKPTRLPFMAADRLVLGWICRLLPNARDALAVVRPETVMRWHRAGFRSYWRWKSRGWPGRPALPAEIRKLIREMSLANPLWGAPRVHGELLKLGIDVGQTSVAKYMVRTRKSPSQG